MNLTFKEYLTEVTKKKVNVKTDTYNWAMSPHDWSDVKDVNKIAGDASLNKIPTESAQRIWGKRNPKPSDPFVEQPSNKTFTVNISGTKYLINLDKRSSGTTVNEKRVEKGESFLGDKERATSHQSPKQWRDISTTVTRDDVKDMTVYSSDSLWGAGNNATPETPFKKVPSEKSFVVKINNTRYLIKLGATPDKRTIKHVTTGAIGILGSGSRRR